jgi:hypothetical protein
MAVTKNFLGSGAHEGRWQRGHHTTNAGGRTLTCHQARGQQLFPLASEFNFDSVDVGGCVGQRESLLPRGAGLLILSEALEEVAEVLLNRGRGRVAPSRLAQIPLGLSRGCRETKR